METIKIKEMQIRFRETDGKMYFTASDLQVLPEWPNGPLLELINGELFIVPSPSTYHQEIKAEIVFQIKSFLKENSIGRIFPSPYGVYFSEENYVIPDIIFVASENEKIVTTKNIQGVPNLIIEVLSSNRNNDLILKRNLYEEQGVPEYLIIDPQEKRIFHYLLINQRYQSPDEYSFTELIKLKSLPDFLLKLE